MIKKIKLGIPILFPGYTILMSPPCLYCGKPVDTEKNYYWSRKGTYQTQHWGQGQKFGNWQLWPDQSPPCNYSIKLPYCPEHIIPINKKYRMIALLPWIGLFGGMILSLLIFALVFPALNLDRDVEIFLFILLMAFSIFGGYIIGKSINTSMAKKTPVLYDIAAFDQYGVEVEGVDIVSKIPGDPVLYYLKVWVSQEYIARNILNFFPGTIVYKGQDLIDKK